jgi:hypothetical protein
MAEERRGLPYIYCSWLSPIIAGDKHCVWAVHFKSHYKYAKRPSSFDLTVWTMQHTALVREKAVSLRAAGWDVKLEDQNSFKLTGKSAILAGKPDIVATRDGEALVWDGKTGQQKHADNVQVLLYIFALPKIRPELRGVPIRGEVGYRSGEPVAVDPDTAHGWQEEIVRAIQRVGRSDPPPRVPSQHECRFCDIGPVDCPDRWPEDDANEVFTTEW